MEEIGTMESGEKDTSMAPDFFDKLLVIPEVADRVLFDVYQYLIKAWRKSGERGYTSD